MGGTKHHNSAPSPHGNSLIDRRNICSSTKGDNHLSLRSARLKKISKQNILPVLFQCVNKSWILEQINKWKLEKHLWSDGMEKDCTKRDANVLSSRCLSVPQMSRRMWRPSHSRLRLLSLCLLSLTPSTPTKRSSSGSSSPTHLMWVKWQFIASFFLFFFLCKHLILTSISLPA